MSHTPVVPTINVPSGSVWDIGQLTQQQLRDLQKRVRSGELQKVRASWCGISPLKMVYIRAGGQRVVLAGTDTAPSVVPA